MAQGWWQRRGLMARLLYPLSCLTRLVVSHQQGEAAKANAWRAPVPVLVIGNIYVGGTGKTPVVIACAKSLCLKGWKPGIVSRGYGVEIGPTPRVAHGQADPGLYGDEPALIALESGCPISVHPRRKLAIEALLTAHPEVNVIISDDGLQHVEMARDVEIVVQDERGVGNGWLLPAGPLREPVSRLDEVDAVITRISNVADQEKPSLLAPPTTKPRHITMTLQPTCFRQVQTGRTLSLSEMRVFAQDKTVVAAAGIGVPQRFFDTLMAAGMSLAWARPLPDHVQMDANTFSDIQSDLIFITAKDAVKCRSLDDERLWALEVEPCFMDRDHAERRESDFLTWLDHRLRELAVQKA
jgi:tetraacyldisaccharide 4'-kinase